MDIYTVFYTHGTDELTSGDDRRYIKCFVGCEIRDSYKTLNDAVAQITNEINASAYTPPNYQVNVVQTNFIDDNLDFGQCWTIEGAHGVPKYFIVKRTLR